MNKIFKVIWSKSKQCYIVVSEMAKNHSGKKKIVVASILAAMAVGSDMGVSVHAGGLDGGNAASPGSIAIGSNSFAKGTAYPGVNTIDPSIAIGANSVAEGNSSLAVGLQSYTRSSYAVAIGRNTRAEGDYGVGIGYNVKVSQDGVAVGEQAKALKRGATTLGVSSRGYSQGGVAIGWQALAGADVYTAGVPGNDINKDPEGKINQYSNWGDTSVGLRALATGGNATALGRNAAATAANAVAIGGGNGNSFNDNTERTQASGVKSTAIGYNSTASGTSASTLGTNASASAENAVAIGTKANASGANATSIGTDAQASKVRSTAIGYEVRATGNNAVAIGSSDANDRKVVAAGESAIAVGTKAQANNDSSTAIGKEALAGNTNAIALGTSAEGKGDASTAIGKSAQATKAKSIALGNEAEATEASATAIGDGANAEKANAVAIGKGAISGGTSGVAVGNDAQAQAADTIAVGSSSRASSANDSAFGNAAQATGGASTAIGYTVNASGNQSFGAGSNTSVSGTAAVGIGYKVTASGDRSISIGNNNGDTTTSATGSYTVAIGSGTTAGGSGAVAIGKNVQNTKDYTTAIGLNLTASESATASVLLGYNSTTQGNQSVNIGSTNTTEKAAQYSTAIGYKAKVGGKNAIAIGSNPDTGNELIASATNSVAIGTSAQAKAEGATALGYGAGATSSNALAFGTSASSSAEKAVALGNSATATANSAVAIGDSAQSKANHSVAIGTNAKVLAGQGNVALGWGTEIGNDDVSRSNKVPDAQKTYAYLLDKSSEDAANDAGNGIVAIGKKRSTGDGQTIARRLTGLAGGVNDYDAVNLKQVKALESNERHIKAKTGNDAYKPDATGKITLNYVNGKGQDVANEVAEITDVAKKSDEWMLRTQNGTTTADATPQTISGLSKKAVTLKAGDNIAIENSNGTVTIKAKDVVTSITSGNNTALTVNPNKGAVTITPNIASSVGATGDDGKLVTSGIVKTALDAKIDKTAEMHIKTGEYTVDANGTASLIQQNGNNQDQSTRVTIKDIAKKSVVDGINTTVNTHTTQISDLTSAVGGKVSQSEFDTFKAKAITFTGDDNAGVARTLDTTLTVKGGANYTSTTPNTNIRVEKDGSTGAAGLLVKLSDKLTGMKEIAGDGKTDLVIKNGTNKVTITPGKDNDKGTINFGDAKVVASNLEADITYRANGVADTAANTVKLKKGLNFTAATDTNTTTDGPKSGLSITTGADGLVTFGLDKATRSKVDNAADKNLSNLSDDGNNKITNLAKAAAKETVKVAPGINTTVDTDTTTTAGVTTYKVNANDTTVAVTGDGLSISGGDLGATNRVRAYTLDLSAATKGKLAAVGNLAGVIGGTTIAADGTVTGPTFNITKAEGGTEAANTLKDAIDKLNATNAGQNTTISNLTKTVNDNYTDLSKKITDGSTAVTNTITTKGLNFTGDDTTDNGKVHRDLGTTLTIKGAENFTRAAAEANNIKVVKNNDALDVKLAENLANIKEIAGDGKTDLVIKNGTNKVTITPGKDNDKGTINFGDAKVVASNLEADITYRANGVADTAANTVKLKKGLNFTAATDTNTTTDGPKSGISITTGADGLVTFGLDKTARSKVDNAADKSLSNLSDDGKDKVKELAKTAAQDAVKVAPGINTTVTTDTTTTAGVTTYKVNANDTKVAITGDGLAISGGDLGATDRVRTYTLDLSEATKGKLKAVSGLATVIGGTNIATDGTVTGPTFNITKAEGGTETANTLKDAIDKLNATNAGQNTKISETAGKVATLETNVTNLGNTVTSNYNDLSNKITQAGTNLTTTLTEKGLDFYGNKDAADTDKVHRNLGESLKVKGAENFTRAEGSTNNIDVVKNATGDGLDVKLAENLSNIKEIAGDGTHDLVIKNGDTKITVEAPKDGNKGVVDLGDAKLKVSDLDANISYKAGTETAKNKVKLQDGFNFVAGTGTVAPKTLAAGETSSTANTDNVEPKKGITISTAENGVVNIGLDSDTRGAIDNAANKDLSNLSTAGSNKVTELAKTAAQDAVKVAPGINTTVTSDTTTTAGVTTYKVNANDTTVAVSGTELTIDGGTPDATTKIRAYTLGLSDATKGKLAAVGNLATVIGGTTIAENGTVTGPTFNITKADGNAETAKTLKDAIEKLDAANKDQNTNITNLGTRINNLVDGGMTFVGDDTTADKVTRKLGETLNIHGQNNITVKKDGTDATTLNVKLASELKNITSITNADADSKPGSKITLGADGVSIANTAAGQDGAAGETKTVTIGKDGINAGGMAVTNVAKATKNSDAANKEYVDEAISNLGNIVSGNATLNFAGNVTKNAQDADVDKVGLPLATGTLHVKGLANEITTTAKGDTITVELAQAVKDQLAKVGDTASNGRDGANGLTGKDGLNDKTVSEKVNALRNGEAGTVVYTDDAGERLVKANDGKYYHKDDLKADGTPKTADENNGTAPKAVDNPQARVVNANGEVKTATTLSNIADGKVVAGSKEAVNGGQLHTVKSDLATALGGDSKVNADGSFTGPTYNITKDDGSNTTEEAKSVGDAISKLDTRINNANTNLGNKGLDFYGNKDAADIDKVHRNLGEALKVKGAENFTRADGATNNIDVVKNAAGDGLDVKLAENLGNMKGISGNGTDSLVIKNGDATITLTPAKPAVNDPNGGEATPAKPATVDFGDSNVVAKNLDASITYRANNDTDANAKSVKLQKGLNFVASNVATTTEEGPKSGLAITTEDNGKVIFGLDKDTRSKVVAVGNLATVIGGTTIAADGAVTGPTFNITKADGTSENATTLKDAIEKLDAANAGQNTAITNLGTRITNLVDGGMTFIGDDATADTVTRKLGETLNIHGQNNITVKKAANSKDTLNVTLASELKNITSITNADADGKPGSKITLGADGVSIANTAAGQDGAAGATKSVTIGKDGINAGGMKITNVAEATADGDAANKQYVDTAISNLNTKVTNNANLNFAGNVTKNAQDADVDKVGLALATGTLHVKGLANEITTIAKGDTITVELAQTVKAQLAKVGDTASNGRDGANGLTGKDGLNDKTVSEKVNALRNGEAGTVVYTDDAGERLVKANDGKYYHKDDLKADGTPKTADENNGTAPKAVDNPQARVVNANGDVKTATTFSNIADGKVVAGSKEAVNGGQLHTVKSDLATALGGDSKVNADGSFTGPTYNITKDDGSNTTEEAKSVGDAISKLDTRINNANSSLGNKGLDFYGNKDAADTDKVHRNLGEALKVKGTENFTREATATNNITVVKNAAGDGLDVKLAENLGNIKEIAGDGTHDLVIKNGDTKVTVKAPKDGDKGSIDFGDTKLVTNNLDANISYKAGTETAKNKVKLQDGFNFVAGTGTVAPKQLEAGTASSTANTDNVASKKGIVISTAADGVVNIGLDSDTRGAIDNAANKDLSNLTQTGKDQVTSLAKTAAKEVVKVAPGINTTVDTDTTTTDGVTTYKVNAIDTTVAVGSDALTINNATPDTNKVRAYTVDLSDATKGKLAAVGNLATVIGSTTIAADGAVTGPTFNITKADGTSENATTLKDAIEKLDAANKDQNTNITNLGARINNLVDGGMTFIGDDATADTVTRKLGETLNIHGQNNISVKKAANSKDTLNVTLASELKNITSITNTDADGKPGSKITLGVDGVSIANTSAGQDGAAGETKTVTIGKDGINAGNMKITNVAEATENGDATNKQYVDTAISNLKDTVTKNANLRYAGDTNEGADADKTYLNLPLATDTLKVAGTTGEIKTVAKAGTITLSLEKAVTDKLSQLGDTTSNGRDGANGLTGNDGLNGKTVSEKVNALRNGEAGTVVYTDDAGERLVKANDGKYYHKDDLKADGTPKTADENNGTAPKAVDNPQARVVNANGDVKTATTLSNIADGKVVAGSKEAVNGGQLHTVKSDLATALGGDSKVNADGSFTGPTYNITKDDGSNTTEEAKSVGDAISKLDTRINNANASLGNKGLDFYGNKDAADTDKVHRNLGEALKVKGAENFTRAATATNNIDVVKNAAGDGLDVKLAENLGNIKEIAGDGTHDLVIKNGDANITLKPAKPAVNDPATGDVTTPAKPATVDFGDSNVVAKNLDASITYRANNDTDADAKSVKLQKGLNFVASDVATTTEDGPKSGLVIKAEDDGKVTFGLDKATREKVDNAADKDLSNLSEVGNNKITNLAKAAAKETVKVANGINTTVDTDTTTTEGVTTYKVNANDTKVAIAGDGLTISGGDLGATDRVRTYTLDLSDATKGKLAAVGNLANVIGGTTIAADGTVTGPTFNITKADGTGENANTLKEAIEKLDAANRGQNEKITNLGNSITEKGLDFYGNKDATDTDKVHRNLGEALKVKGTDNFTREATATNNITVVKNTAGDGLYVKLAENLVNMKEIAGDGKTDLVIKNGDASITLKPGKPAVTDPATGDETTPAKPATVDFGDSNVVAKNLDASITYRANNDTDGNAKSVKLKQGLNFVAGTGTVAPKHLETGTASPTATTDSVEPKKGIVISTAENGVVNIGLDSDTRSAIDNAANQDLSNLTTAGKQAITDAAQGAVKVAAGNNVTIDTETKNNVTTYTVNGRDTTVKAATGGSVSVTGGDLNAKGEREYTVDLTDAAKAEINRIAGIDTRLTTAEGNITTLQGDMTKAKEDIAGNTQAINTNKQEIAKNAGDIATNAGNIKTNATNIAKNAGDIATNAGNIKTNATNIATNAGNIATNTANITKNAGDIATNAGNIKTNADSITTNAAAIAKNAGDIKNLQGNSATKDLSNLTNAGKDVVTGLVNVVGTNGITVKSDTDTTSRVKTFTAKLDDKVTFGKEGNKITIDGTTGTITAPNASVNVVNTNTVQVGDANKTNTAVTPEGVTVTTKQPDGTVTSTVIIKDGTVSGLTNTKWDPTKVMDTDRSKAATQGQVKDVSDTLQKGRVFAADTGVASTTVALGDTLAIKGGAKGPMTDNNIGVELSASTDKTPATMTVRLAKDVKMKDGSTSYNYYLPEVITKADGTKDIAKNADGTVKYQTDKEGKPISIVTTTVNGEGITIAPVKGLNKPSVSLTADGLDNGGNAIHHVAPGTAADDAATLGQVVAAASTVSRQVNQTGAHAAALAAMNPLSYDPLKKSQVMAGYGAYKGNSALALGVAHYANEDTLFNVGVSVGNGENMVNAGMTYRFGGEDSMIPERYKGGPISSVYVMQDEITALKAENARKDAENAKKEAENEEMKAQIKMLIERVTMLEAKK